MDLGKKDLFDANPEKELPAKRDSPGSTKGSNFMSNSLAAIRWQGLVKYSTDQEKPQAELSASRSLFMPPESATACGQTTVSSFYQQTETCPIQSQWQICIPRLIYTDQSELHNLDTSFT